MKLLPREVAFVKRFEASERFRAEWRQFCRCDCLVHLVGIREADEHAGDARLSDAEADCALGRSTRLAFECGVDEGGSLRIALWR